MRCPNDGAQLVMSERQGVEIDYCPSCRGIWLDRGELDKIIERSVGVPTPGLDTPAPAVDPRYAPDPRGGYDPGYRDPGYRDDHRDGYRDDHRGDPRYGDRDKKRKRKESWLGDLFDF